MSNLDKHQRLAAHSDFETPVLLEAAAGSGKTTTLVARVVKAIESGIHPEKILAITYTNLAANQLRTRVAEALGNDLFRVPRYVGTIHSISKDIFYSDLDSFFEINRDIFKNPRNQKLLSRKISIVDAGWFLRWKWSKFYNKSRDKCEDAISFWRYEHLFRNHPDFKRKSLEYKDVREPFLKFRANLMKNGSLEHDDFLIEAIKILDFSSFTNNYWSNKFELILLDECQDLDLAKWELIKRLLNNNNFFAVGDQAQSIYHYIEGTFDNAFQIMEDFFKDRSVQVRKLALHNTYRFGENVFSFSLTHRRYGQHELVPANRITNLAEGSVLDEIYDTLSNQRENLWKWAILFRSKKEFSDTISQLSELDIPFKVSSSPIFENDTVVAMISFLKSVYSDNSHAVRRAIKTFCSVDAKESLWSVYKKHEPKKWFFKWVLDAQNWVSDIDIKDADKLLGFISALNNFRNNLPNDLRKLILDMERVRVSGSEKRNKASSREKTIDIFASWMGLVQRKNPHLEIYEIIADLDKFCKFTKEEIFSKDYESRNFITLSTIHASKGLEWDNVAVYNHSELIDDTIEEVNENLPYVAFTRAKENLFLVHKKKKAKKKNPLDELEIKLRRF